jgi:DNA (cytosine-5)-methyltransferase 1
MKHGSLFSGIGGFDLAAEWMGWENVFHCEWNEFGQRVLKHHFPKALSYADITETDFNVHRGRISVLSGGFPCQPYSSAGKRLGKEDDRHLWPEMLRAIREIQPRWVVGENVLGLVNWNGGLVFEEVQADLEAEGYEVQPFILPAASVNAPHRRDRVWFVAYRNAPDSDRNGRQEEAEREQGANEKDKEQFKCVHTSGNAADTDNGSGSKDTIPARGKEFDELYGLSRNAPDSEFNDRQKSPRNVGQESRAEGKGGDKSTDGANNDGEKGNAPDSDNELRQRRDGQGTPNRSTFTEKRTESLNVPRSWEEFPTKPPICGGNDGLPRELDNITFPKWRNESIKAYGNAIVPQVAHQIFKAIQAYEESLLY